MYNRFFFKHIFVCYIILICTHVFFCTPSRSSWFLHEFSWHYIPNFPFVFCQEKVTKCYNPPFWTGFTNMFGMFFSSQLFLEQLKKHTCFLFIMHPKKKTSKILDIRFMILRAEKTRNIKKRQQNFVPRYFSVRLPVFPGGGEKTKLEVLSFFWSFLGWKKASCFFFNILKVV